MRHPRILIVDDDIMILKFLQANLEARDCDTITAMDGTEALNAMERELPDLVILDIVMPNMDGFEACRRIRERSLVPIIMLSARGDASDKVKCLNLGADDYITKPFGVSELMARVRSVLRRTEVTGTPPTQPSFTCGDLKIDFAKRVVTVAGNEVKLTPTEYSLLEEFVVNAGKVLTYKYLLNKVWGPEYKDEKDYLSVSVDRLRAKLETDPTKHRYINTVPDVGYQFNGAYHTPESQ